MMFKIRVEAGPGAGQAFVSPTLEEGMLFRVGRDRSNDVSLDADFVSSVHGEFLVHDGKLYFRDLRSTNGSAFLRGGELTPLDEENGLAILVRDADVIVLGRDGDLVRLRVHVGEALDEKAVDGQGEPTVLAFTKLESVKAVQGRLTEDPTWAQRLYRASQLMDGTLDLNRVCQSACAAVFELLSCATNISILMDQRQRSALTSGEDAATSAENADFVPFLSMNREGQPIAGERPSRKVVAEVLERKAAVLICDMEDFGASQSIARAKIRSIIGVPLAVGERVTGIVQVDNRQGDRSFVQRDMEGLVVLARQLALAIENARLFQRVKVTEVRLTGENLFLKSKARRHHDIIGQSASIKAVFELIDRVVDTNATVLITGETGTGKEVIARAIHYRSKRKDQLFVPQNCSALPENLLESELFGHKKGSFTGADSEKKGLFEIAHRGTIFLDEIGETSPALQAKLLRVLQESEVRPVGAMYPKKVDSRVVAATNRKLQLEVTEGRFREDLFYRLNVFPIHLPPLRERGDDIRLLAEHFLARFSREYNRPVVSFSPETIAIMCTYKWPGNIRELENEIQRLVIYGVSGEFILPEHLAPRLRRGQALLSKVAPAKGGLKQMMEEVERWLLMDTLNRHENNKTRAAKELLITREGLHKKLTRFGM